MTTPSYRYTPLYYKMVALRNGKDTEIMAKYFNLPKETYTHQFIMSSIKEMFSEFEKLRETLKISEQVMWINYLLQFTASLPDEWLATHKPLVQVIIDACKRNIVHINEYLNDPDPRLQEFVNRPLFESSCANIRQAQATLEQHLLA
jgi:hypothetical protein